MRDITDMDCYCGSEDPDVFEEDIWWIPLLDDEDDDDDEWNTESDE